MKVERKLLRWILGLFFVSYPLVLWAAVQLGSSLMFTPPGLIGVEFQGSYLFQPFSERAYWIGPHFNLMWAGSSEFSRMDAVWGVENTLWLGNLIGLGFAMDGVAPSSLTTQPSLERQTQSVHLRINPSVSLRFSRFQKFSAWAFRFGVPYDPIYRWSAQLGISLQIGGVPLLGISPPID